VNFLTTLWFSKFLFIILEIKDRLSEKTFEKIDQDADYINIKNQRNRSIYSIIVF